MNEAVKFDVPMSPKLAARHRAKRLAEVTPLAALTIGMRGQYKQRFVAELFALSRKGKLRRFLFDGRVLYAPIKECNEVAFVVAHALETTRKEPGSGCMHWAGFTHTKKGPILSLGRAEYQLRRRIWEARPGSHELHTHDAIRMACGESDCICPEHMRKEPRNRPLKGKSRPLLARAHLAEARRANSPRTLEQIQDIRARYARGEIRVFQAANELGMSTNNTRLILQGKAWRDFKNPLQGLVK